MSAETFTAPVPETAGGVGVDDAYGAVPLPPYSKWYCVLCPFGFTVPCRVAPVSAIGLALPVVTLGGPGPVLVVNVRSAPTSVPPAQPPQFVATMRKW